MINEQYLRFWMNFWCATLDSKCRNYAEYMLGKAIGINYNFPLTEAQSLEILKAVDSAYPWLYREEREKPRPGGWIRSLEDGLSGVKEEFLRYGKV